MAYKQGTCWDGYVQKGMKKKGKKMVPNCVPVTKAAMGRAMFSQTTTKAPGDAQREKYIGSYMSMDLNILLIELVLELEKPKRRNIQK